MSDNINLSVSIICQSYHVVNSQNAYTFLLSQQDARDSTKTTQIDKHAMSLCKRAVGLFCAVGHG